MSSHMIVLGLCRVQLTGNRNNNEHGNCIQQPDTVCQWSGKSTHFSSI